MRSSIGARSTKKIACVFCPQEVLVPLYRPREGKSGEKLRGIGPFIDFPPPEGHPERQFWGPVVFVEDESREIFQKGRLCRLRRISVPHRDYAYFRVELFHLTEDSNPYANKKPRTPHFGLGEQFVIWVCEHCMQLLEADTEKVHYHLARKAEMYLRFEQAERAKPIRGKRGRKRLKQQ